MNRELILYSATIGVCAFLFVFFPVKYHLERMTELNAELLKTHRELLEQRTEGESEP